MVRRSGAGDEERALRVEAGEPDAEVAALLRGLRGGAQYSLRVRAVTRRGAAPPGRAVTARAPPPDALAGAAAKSKCTVHFLLLCVGRRKTYYIQRLDFIDTGTQ